MFTKSLSKHSISPNLLIKFYCIIFSTWNKTILTFYNLYISLQKIHFSKLLLPLFRNNKDSSALRLCMKMGHTTFAEFIRKQQNRTTVELKKTSVACLRCIQAALQLYW